MRQKSHFWQQKNQGKACNNSSLQAERAPGLMIQGTMKPGRVGSYMMGVRDGEGQSFNQDMEQELVGSNSSGGESDFEDELEGAAGGDDEDPGAAYVVD
jgi:hypothetical protein